MDDQPKKVNQMKIKIQNQTLARSVVGAVIGLGLIASSGCQQKHPDQPTASNGDKAIPAQEEATGNSISGWASDTWNGAISSGSQSVEDTGQWISEMYNSAKDKGITSATSVKEWVTDDWNAQGDWQYKLITLDPADPQAIEAKLNEAGADRWESYHVDTSGSQWIFFMKRSRRSYLSRVPLKDLANMLPGVTGESDE